MTLPPDLLDRLRERGEIRDVRPLVGGRGGRTFAVELSTLTAVVHVRQCGTDALDREARATSRAYAAGVGPEVLDVWPEHQALVTRWVPGESLRPGALTDRGLLVAVATAVRRLHDAGPDLTGAEVDPVASRAAYLRVADERGLTWPAGWHAESARIDELIGELTGPGRAAQVACHGDLTAANLVARPDGTIVVLDHEYAGIGDPAADLGGLAATGELGDASTIALADAYGARPGVTPERVIGWRDLTRQAWFAWVMLGEDLGPERERWTAWAGRVRERWAH